MAQKKFSKDNVNSEICLIWFISNWSFCHTFQGVIVLEISNQPRTYLILKLLSRLLPELYSTRSVMNYLRRCSTKGYNGFWMSLTWHEVYYFCKFFSLCGNILILHFKLSLSVWFQTTLAHIIANSAKGSSNARFVSLSATTSGISDIKEMVKVAKNEQQMFKRKTILFVDEIHRFNKLQQASIVAM